MTTLQEFLEPQPEPVPRSLRRRVLRSLGLFMALQAAVAIILSIRNKRAVARLIAKRPPTYPSRSFDPVPLDNRDDTVQLFMRGDALLADMIEAIDGAVTRIMFETFILVGDSAGIAIRDALVRAAERGVKVYVLWDPVMSDSSIDETFFPPPIEVHLFKPIRPSITALKPSNILRNHRKVLVVDDSVAYCGGYNIGNLYLEWRDTHLRVDGAAALEVANSFTDFWNFHTASMASRFEDIPGRIWDPHVIVHRNDPSMAIFPIRGMYMEAMDRASERIWITNAYFIPDRSFRAALTTAARRGVDVRVMLPARSNHPLTDVLAHGMFDEILAAGVRVFLYADFMVHAKTAVIDSEWVTIGTANLDRWSMLGNYEVNLEVRCSSLAAQMIELFEFDMENCHELHVDGWRRRPLHWRASERVLKSMAPLM